MAANGRDSWTLQQVHIVHKKLIGTVGNMRLLPSENRQLTKLKEF